MSSAEGSEKSSAEKDGAAFDSQLPGKATEVGDEKTNPSRDMNHSAELSAMDEEAVLRRAALELADRKAEARALALIDVARAEGATAIERLAECLADDSLSVRSAAVKALYDVAPKRAASIINSFLRDNSLEQRHKIGSALAASNLAVEALKILNQNSDADYDALSLIFLLAKAGLVEPLMPIILNHTNLALRVALIKMLGASGQPEVIHSFHTLALKGSLAAEVRSAVMAALYQSSAHASRR